MGSSSTFGGIFGRRKIGGISGQGPQPNLGTGSPWHQGQLQMMFRIFRVLSFFFPVVPSHALVVFRSSVGVAL